LRSEVDALPFYRTLKSSGTTLGDLQAALTLAKLRPGAWMLWLREEPISSADGQECLQFLLDRGLLICEWDLHLIKHSLPASAICNACSL
jgi:hypothetical protein